MSRHAQAELRVHRASGGADRGAGPVERHRRSLRVAAVEHEDAPARSGLDGDRRAGQRRRVGRARHRDGRPGGRRRGTVQRLERPGRGSGARRSARRDDAKQPVELPDSGMLDIEDHHAAARTRGDVERREVDRRRPRQPRRRPAADEVEDEQPAGIQGADDEEVIRGDRSAREPAGRRRRDRLGGCEGPGAQIVGGGRIDGPEARRRAAARGLHEQPAAVGRDPVPAAEPVAARAAAILRQRRAIQRGRREAEDVRPQRQLLARVVPVDRRRRALDRALPQGVERVPARVFAATPVVAAEQQLEAGAVDVHQHVSGMTGTGTTLRRDGRRGRRRPRSSSSASGSPATTEIPATRGSSSPLSVTRSVSLACARRRLRAAPAGRGSRPRRGWPPPAARAARRAFRAASRVVGVRVRRAAGGAPAAARGTPSSAAAHRVANLGDAHARRRRRCRPTPRSACTPARAGTPRSSPAGAGRCSRRSRRGTAGRAPARPDAAGRYRGMTSSVTAPGASPGALGASSGL